jgi:hypothetical protein
VLLLVTSDKIIRRAVSIEERPTSRTFVMEGAMDITTPDKIERICALNDDFRKTFRGGEVILTASVAELPDMVKSAVLEQVATFEAFNEENDPYGEHDYGSFDYCNREFFFKIDYLRADSDVLSEDPADTTKTRRILTVGLSMDW